MILIRHADPVIQPCTAPVNWPLSTSGHNQAIALANRLSAFQPDAICTSPERKARETAEVLGAKLHLEVTIVPNLREHDRDGVPFLHTPGEFEESVRRLFEFPFERTFGNESAAAALARFRQGIAQVIALDARLPVVVSHGTVMSLLVAAELGGDAFRIWEQLRAPCYVPPQWRGWRQARCLQP